jgi:hypothetical protein
MEAIRSRLNKIKLPEEFCLSSKQVTRILAESSNIHIAEKISDSINMASEDLADASLLAAISIQPGRLPIETLAALQKQDAACNKLRADVPKNFTVKSDVLLRVRNEHSESLLTPQIVLPDILVPLVIQLEHNKGMEAHIPYKRVAKTLSAKYYFPNMYERVKNHIHACLPCQFMAYHTRPSHKLHPFNVPTAPRQLIGIDLATDLPPVKNLNHVVLLVDYNTNYIHVTPVKSKSSSDLLHAFTQYVKDFGIPHAVRHDQELGLTGGNFAAFCSAHNIKQMTTLPYKGQSNGRTEVQIRNFEHALQKHCLAADAKSTWPDEIWKIQLSLNTSTCLATNATPESLLFSTTLPNKTTDLAHVITTSID